MRVRRCGRRDGAHRAGFTLVEVLVALAVAGVVLLAARQMLEALAAHAGRVSAAAERADRDANADRVLRALVGDLEVGTGDGRDFEGQERAAHFMSWCDVPAGWRERCAVALAFDSTAADGNVLTLRMASGASSGPAGWSRAVVVRRGLAGGALRYLGDAGQGGTWFRAWGRGITAPLALAVIVARPATDSAGVTVHVDTLIVRIGDRG